MYYLYGIASIAIFIIAKYLLKLTLQISLLIAVLLGSLIAGLPEFGYRWVFAFGGVTDLILKVSLGILIVIFLNKIHFFSTSISRINENISNQYLNAFLKTIIFAIPGMLSGSFIVTGIIFRSSLEFTEENREFLWFAAFIGVISPPVNIYYQLLDSGLIGGYGFSGLDIMNKLALVTLALLIISPFIFRKVVVNPKESKSKSLFLVTRVFVVIFLIGEIFLRRLMPEILFPAIINFFIFFLIMGSMFIYYKNKHSNTLLESFKEIEKDFSATLPYLFLILLTGFTIAMSVHTGFRGSLIILLEDLSNEYFLIFAILGSLSITVLSPFLSLSLIALPALFVPAANDALFLAFVISLPLFYYILNRDTSVEGYEASICIGGTITRILISLITLIVWGNAFIGFI